MTYTSILDSTSAEALPPPLLTQTGVEPSDFDGLDSL